jgi:hypothetical protein
MGRTNAPVTAVAVFAAVYAAWHFTGGMHGTVVHVQTPPPASAVTTSSLTTSQCQNLPASTAATPSPSPSSSSSLAATPTSTAGPGELCVSVQATQDSIRAGGTAVWTIEVSAQGGSATAVSITLATIPSGPTPVFSGSCPSGGGTTACTVGDMDTAVTPTTYQLQAQVTVPAGSKAGPLTLVASADTSPIMASVPAAGQTISITSPPAATKPKVKPSTATTPVRTTAAQPTPAQPVPTPASQPGTIPVASEPAVGGLPTPASVTTTVAPGSVSGVLPQITPEVATTPTPAPTVLSSPAANIQAAGASPTPTSGADSFAISIRMSAQTAQVLGWILLALVVTLIASKLVTDYVFRNRQPRQPRQPRQSRQPRQRAAKTTASGRRIRLPRIMYLPRLKRNPHPRPRRAERSATREQNWKRYLESQQPSAADETVADGTAETVMKNSS